MRIIHTADWHLGRDFYGYDLREYQDRFLDTLLSQIREHQPDALLIAGDVLDKPNPADSDMDMLSDFLNQAHELTQVVLISGNHDGASRLGFARGFTKDRVTIVTKASQVGKAIEVHDRSGDLAGLVYAIPYLYPYADRAQLSSWVDTRGQRHLDASLEGLPARDDGGQPRLPGKAAALFGAALRRIGNDLAARKTTVPVVGMAHDYLREIPYDTEGEYLGTLQAVSASAVDDLGGSRGDNQGLDYLALGHLHSPHPVAGTQTPCWYAGSPLPYNVSEPNRKCTLLVEIDAAHQTHIEKLVLPLSYQVAELQDDLESLTDAANPKYAKLRDAFCQITLSETTLPPGAYGRLKAAFPHLVALNCSQTPRSGDSSVKIDFREISPVEFAKGFLRECHTDDAVIALLDQVYEAAMEAGTR